MNKDVLMKLPQVFLKPRKYFTHSISNNSYEIKDLLLVAGGVFPIIIVLHLLGSNNLPSLNSELEKVFYLLGITLGVSISFAFRTYFLTMVLNRSGANIDYKSIGMVVGIAFIPILLMYLMPILLQTSDYNRYLSYVMNAWNLLLIIIGVVTISGMSWIKAGLITLTMFGFEMVVKMVFAGTSV